jgi:cytoskeletal protein CcmA (bactofilin family)
MFSKAKADDRPQGGGMPSIVSADLRIKGNLDSEGDIQINGVVDGDVRSRLVTVGESGVINGSVRADVLRVMGTVNGRITARAVEILHTAKVTADVDHETLAVEAGAQLHGFCKRPDSQVEAAQPEAEAPRPTLQVAEIRGASPDERRKAAG